MKKKRKKKERKKEKKESLQCSQGIFLVINSQRIRAKE